jgi:hypothetical protein
LPLSLFRLPLFRLPLSLSSNLKQLIKF